MAKFRKLPIVIEAFKWTGGPDQVEDPEWMIEALRKEWGPNSARIIRVNPGETVKMEIFTLEGRHTANMGDWIIQGVEKELYVCKDSIFQKTYEKV